MRLFHNIRAKIIVSTVLCILFTGFVSNAILYGYFKRDMVENAARTDAIYLENMCQRLDERFQNIWDQCLMCAYDSSINKTLDRTDVNTSNYKNALILAQQRMVSYFFDLDANNYIQNALVFNDRSKQCLLQLYSNPLLPTFDKRQEQLDAILQQETAPIPLRFFTTVSLYKGSPCFSILVPLSGGNENYLYVEIGTQVITEMASEYGESDILFAVTDQGELIGDVPLLSVTQAELSEKLASLGAQGELQMNENLYFVNARSVDTFGLTLYHGININALNLDSGKLLEILVTAAAVSLIVAIVILFLFSRYITQPLQRLTQRIKQISANDFSFDPAIEQSHDEIGAIGKVVNEMSGSIQQLLSEVLRTEEEKRVTELALLQSQVNPHFLYNTLDTIYWMSVMQKAPGIGAITKSLTRLLRNIARGVSEEIPLSDELALLEDYVAIQSTRYIGLFDFVNEVGPEFRSYKILKFTLQPLVENAIFHGIEPKGQYGTITVTAQAEDNVLSITVRDTGVGMTAEEIHDVMQAEPTTQKNAMGGIGLANVARRLQLHYGNNCGIHIESEKDLYTAVTVRVPVSTTGDDRHEKI